MWKGAFIEDSEALEMETPIRWDEKLETTEIRKNFPETFLYALVSKFVIIALQ